MTGHHGEMDLKKLILTIAMLVAVLVVMSVFLMYIMEATPFGGTQDESGQCAQQEDESLCTSLTTTNWIGEQKQKCFWNEEEETCGRQVN